MHLMHSGIKKKKKNVKICFRFKCISCIVVFMNGDTQPTKLISPFQIRFQDFQFRVLLMSVTPSRGRASFGLFTPVDVREQPTMRMVSNVDGANLLQKSTASELATIN